jgi:hypothetical protein
MSYGYIQNVSKHGGGMILSIHWLSNKAEDSQCLGNILTENFHCPL